MSSVTGAPVLKATTAGVAVESRAKPLQDVGDFGVHLQADVASGGRMSHAADAPRHRDDAPRMNTTHGRADAAHSAARSTPATGDRHGDADARASKTRDAAVDAKPHDEASSRTGASTSRGPSHVHDAQRQGSKHMAVESDDGDATADRSDGVVGPSSTPRRTTTSGDDAAASLPDRMLALLTGEMLATPRPSTGPTPIPDAGAASGASPIGAGMPSTMATAASNAPPAAITTIASDASVATASTQPASPPPASVGLAAPGALSLAWNIDAAATATSAGVDGLVALASALGGRSTSRDTDGSSPATADAPAPAFAPLLARGADALQAATRTAAVMASAPTLAFDAGFDDGVGERVLWMANERIGHAEIRVTPDALGPIDIRVQMDGHRVHAQFQAANAEVRQSLEAGMDRLRDMLGRHGMELGNAQVGGGSTSNGQGRGGASMSGAPSAGPDAAAEAPVATTVRVIRGRGLLDVYA